MHQSFFIGAYVDAGYANLLKTQLSAPLPDLRDNIGCVDEGSVGHVEGLQRAG